MDEKEFAIDIIKKAINNLSTSNKWSQSYSNLLNNLLNEDKLSNSDEIYNKIIKEANANDQEY